MMNSFYKVFLKSLLMIYIFMFGLTNINAATDSSSIGAGYTMLSWYNLSTKKNVSAPVSQWDISLSTALDASIRTNDASGVKLWYVVGSDATSFDEPGTLDTNGLSTDIEGVKFKQYHNSPKTWAIGAFNMGKNGFAEGGDFGWGQYNQAIHQLTGKSLFIISLPNGQYKKVFIAKWSNWIYTIKHANLDGSDQKTVEINSKDFPGKLFIYYSFVNNEVIDIEPKSDEWDIVFGKYTDVARMGNVVYDNYPVTGARINPKVKVAAVTGVKNNEAQQPGLNQFTNTINSIGYNWKIFNQNTFQWIIPDTITYFVITEDDGYLYKLWFTDFVGAVGNIYFNTERLVLSILDDDINTKAYFGIYPNVVSKGKSFNLFIGNISSYNNIELEIYSLEGKQVYSQSLSLFKNLEMFTIENLNLNSGFYFVRLNIDGKVLSQKLIIN